MLSENVTSERFYWMEPINITKEQWIRLLEDRDIITESDVQLLKLIYNCPDYRATGSQLAQQLRMPHHAPLNRQVGQLGKRIVKKLNILAPKQRYDEGFNWWHVPFWGEARKEGYYWILRPELREALREIHDEEALSLEITMPEEINFESHESLYEGAKKQVYVNIYERNRVARDRCIKHYGAQCIICGFDFEKTYGKVGRDIIHVHHLKPLSEIGETYRVDAIKDLRPVCPNCHLIIHTRNPAYSIDEVKLMIKNSEPGSL